MSAVESRESRVEGRASSVEIDRAKVRVDKDPTLETLALQIGLAEQGDYQGELDNWRGAKTEAALESFRARFTGSNTLGVLRTDWRGYTRVDPVRLANALPAHARELAGAFVEAGEEYALHPLFLAAISKHETASWTSYAYRVKNNAMGISNAAGPTHERSHAESIRKMAKSLASPTGYYRNCRTLEDVWYVYSPPSFKQTGGKPVANDPNDYNKYWGPTVAKYWAELEGAVG